MALDVSYSLLVQFMIAGILGLLASQLWVNQHGGYDLGGTKDTCEGFIEKTKLLKGLKLGTKTPYQFEVEVTDESYMHSCQAVQLYAIFRHGSRFPSPKYIHKWDNFQQLLREKLAGSDLSPSAKLLVSWANPFTKTQGLMEITKQGMWENYCLAQRFKRRYPQLLDQSYLDSVFSFRTTQKPRTVKSALSFAAGLFEDSGPLNGYQPIFLESESLNEDTLLRFFDLKCPYYDHRVTNNQSLSDMIDSFINTSAVRAVVRRVQSQVDPEQTHWNLTANVVMTMYKICIHEIGVFGKSRWCSLFSEEDMLVLEYYLDLKTYWRRGYGFDINWKRSLPLVNSILSFLANHTGDSSPHTQIALRFAHAETLIPLVCFLGLFKDEQILLPTNFEEMKAHEFVVRRIAPYSGSVVFVLYNCPKTTADDQLFVQLLVNEVPTAVPGCAGSTGRGLCPLRELNRLVAARTANEDNLSAMCAL